MNHPLRQISGSPLCLALFGFGLVAPAQAQNCMPEIGTSSGPARVFNIPTHTGRTSTTIKIFVSPTNKVNRVEFFNRPGFLPEVFNGESANAFLQSACPGLTLPAATSGSLARSERPLAGGGRSPIFGQASQTVAAGDFNRDGSLDAAYTSGSQLTVTLYDAAGATISSKTYSLPSNSSQGIVAGDFNGDGKLDLAVELDPLNNSGLTGSIAILIGNGDGTFQTPVNIPLSIAPTSMETADLNGDGKPDLVTSGGGTVNGSLNNYLVVLLGKGDGTFSAPTYTVGGGGSLVVRDFTGDGKIDIATAVNGSGLNNGMIAVYPGNGDGTFRAPVKSTVGFAAYTAAYLAYADLNGDGNLDLGIADGQNEALYIALGNGDGSFQAPQIFTAPSYVGSLSLIPLADGATAVLMADYFGSSLHLAFADNTGQVGLPRLQTIGPGELQPAVAAADLNGDMASDVVLSAATGIGVELNNGTGTFGAPVIYPTGSAPYALAIADLNHDGKPDIVVTHQTGASVLLNSGTGTFTAAAPLGGGPWGPLTLADFNGDGKLDVAVQNVLYSYNGYSSSPVSILLGNGDGTFRAPSALTLPGGFAAPGGIASGDFNGDGKADLIASYASTGGFTSTFAFYPGKGDGTFGTPSVLPVTGSSFAVGDINRDGKLDAVVVQGGTNVVVLLAKGDGTFQAQTPIPIVSGQTIYIKDVNADGKPDLVLGDCCGNAEASYLLGNGDGTFGSQTYFLSGPNPYSIAFGNFFSPSTPGLAIAGDFSLGKVTGTFTVLDLAFAAPPDTGPFGHVDTPASGATGLSGAVNVTGWALSPVGVTTIAIYREPVPGETAPPGGLILLGSAAQVPGARPDLVSAFPGYPQNNYGWGVQVLTNELPSISGGPLGVGTYKLHAIVTDAGGLTADLSGAVTITVNNANATLPFGTIDTPPVGATVSGSGYVNFGWALTPNPANLIPKDGSTIEVYVDNAPVGHPAYNNFRSDIATLFPGLQNSNGAVGFFTIDTTKLVNGLHTIAWVVSDNAGHAQGLGSRYFNVQN